MGINGSGNTAAVFGGANDAYLYNLWQNLLIGTGTAAKVLAFLTGGTTQSTNERMRIDGSGNVGIGTTSFNATYPEKLIVDAGVTGNTNYQNVIVGKGNTNSYAQLNIQNTNAGIGASSDVVATANNGDETTNFIDMGVNSSANTAGVFGGANDAYLYNLGQNLLIGTGTAAKVLAFLTGGTTQSTNERMRIDGSGNVGIGTNAPGSKLDVKGTLRLSGSTSGFVALQPAAVAGSTTYTLPATDGTIGQLLSTDGSGNLSWSSVGIGVAQMVRKTASETVISSTVLQDDDHLFIPVVANGVYQVEVLLNITSSAGGSGGMKIGLSTPTGSTSNVLSEININDDFHWTRAWLTNNTSYSTENTINNAKNPAARMNGIVTVGSTAGVIKIQWAQNSSNSDPSTLLPPSFLKITRIQ